MIQYKKLWLLLFSGPPKTTSRNILDHQHHQRRRHYGRIATSKKLSHNNVDWIIGGESNNNNDVQKIIPPSSLTIILPAYNEEMRIGETIETYCSYLLKQECDLFYYDNDDIIYKEDMGKRENRMTLPTNQTPIYCNIMVIDDGSTDETCHVVERYQAMYKKVVQSGGNEDGNKKNIILNSVSCISLDVNQGKGFAISTGIKEVQKLYYNSYKESNTSIRRGHVILIADADGSGNIESLDAMINELSYLLISHTSTKYCSVWDNKAMVVGNRGYQGTSLARGFTRWGFRTAVKLVCGDLQVNDTQCGFKLMTLNAGIALYNDLHLKRWTNDVEALYRAKKLGIPVSEMVISWEDKDGSKLSSSALGTVWVSLVMLFEILYMRLQYILGRWKI